MGIVGLSVWVRFLYSRGGSEDGWADRLGVEGGAGSEDAVVVAEGALEPASFLNALRTDENADGLPTPRAFLRSRIASPTFLLIVRTRLMLEGPRQKTWTV